ncbi:MAG TPA: hypothetical protein VGL89_17490, partial [Candidatus Koribacter sp.]
KNPSAATARRVAVNATVNHAFGLILVQTPTPMGKFRMIVGDNRPYHSLFSDVGIRVRKYATNVSVERGSNLASNFAFKN